MKQLTEALYVIEEGIYAERRGTQWFVSDEQSAIMAGPFASLEELEAARGYHDTEPTVEALEMDPVEAHDSTDLVTLREAAQFLPVTRQALEYHRRRGTLKVEPVLNARTTTLYSLKALKEAYDR